MTVKTCENHEVCVDGTCLDQSTDHPIDSKCTPAETKCDEVNGVVTQFSCDRTPAFFPKAFLSLLAEANSDKRRSFSHVSDVQTARLYALNTLRPHLYFHAFVDFDEIACALKHTFAVAKSVKVDFLTSSR